jgi:hypothetical protein
MDQQNYLFLIGAPKAGTSSVAATLAQHPDVCLSAVKEPKHFTDFADRQWRGRGSEGFLLTLARTREDYEATFAHHPSAPWRVDASTDYLHCPAAMDRIADFAREPGVGQVRVVVLLRDPVERAISQFQHTVRDGFESGTLRDALAQEEGRIADGHHPLYYHITRSRYHEAITGWRLRFPDLMVLDYHDLRHGGQVIDTILVAMGLKPAMLADVPRENSGHVYKNRLLGVAMRNRGPMFDAARRFVPASLRRALRERLTQWNEVRYTPDPGEIAVLRAALSDDISACVADPSIPTGNWHTAVGNGRGAANAESRADLRERLV